VDPLSEQNLQLIFRERSNKTTIIGKREGYNLEFKKSFGWQSRFEYLRTMAAYANNNGGYILFGIGSSPNTFIGLNEEALERFNSIDDSQWSALIRSSFAPALIWGRTTFIFKKMVFGIIYTYEAKEKPIICRVASGELRKAAIYYRYKAETTEIEYPELSSIIEREKSRINDLWIQKIKQLDTAGIAKTAILNFDTGSVDGNNASLYIDKSLLNQIDFINEGTFVDTGGTPALKIVGEVQTAEPGPPIIIEEEREIVINYDILFRKLFDQEDIKAPKEYIKAACFMPASTIPIYYFIQKAGITVKAAILIIDSTTNAPWTKKHLRNRLKGHRIRQVSVSSLNEQKKTFYDALVEENLVIPAEKEAIKFVLTAIRAIGKSIVSSHKKYLLSVAKQIYSDWYPNQDSAFRGVMREAFCWLDEALYLHDDDE